MANTLRIFATNQTNISSILVDTAFFASPHPNPPFHGLAQHWPSFSIPGEGEQLKRGWVEAPEHPVRPGDSPTSCLVVDALALAAGGVGQQRGLLVVRVHGAGGDDVVLVLVHQGQLGVIAP